MNPPPVAGDLKQSILQSMSEGYWNPPADYSPPEKSVPVEGSKRAYLPIIPGAGLKQLFGSDISGAELLQPVQRADFSAQDEEESKKKEAQAAAKKLMDEARASDEFIRSVDYEPSAEFSDPSKGIIVGDISAEKLKKIRDQAAAKFPGATGGNFVSAEMTPEVAARLAENEKWLQGQELRDAASRLNNRRVDPVAAAQGLAQIAAQQRLQQEQQNKDALIAALSGTSGKVPWDKAAAYSARGISIPQNMIGISREDAMNEANLLLQQAQQDMGQINSLQAIQDPSMQLSAEFSKRAVPIIAQYAQEAQRGDPQEAQRRFWDRFFAARQAFFEEAAKRPEFQKMAPGGNSFGIQIERGVNQQ